MASCTRAILVKETRELVRDPLYLGLAVVIPLVQMLLFGFGLTADVKHVRVAVLDRDRSPLSRLYQDGFSHSEYFNFVGLVRDYDQADDWLRSGRARTIIEIPPTFTRDLAGRATAAVGVTIDGAFPTFSEIIVGYTTAVNAQFSQQLPALLGGGGGARPVSLNVSVWYNPALESKNFVIPGLLVILLQIFPALLGALLITREKEAGTIFTLYASPASRAAILAGKALPYIGVASLDYLLIFAMSIWLFRVPFIGSFWVLTAAGLLHVTCAVGLGLLVSSLVRTQLAAMLIVFLGSVTPTFYLSGFIAPVASQDIIGRVAGFLIPATYFMEVARGCYLKGLGFSVYWRDVAALAAYAGLVYLLAWARLRKRIG